MTGFGNKSINDNKASREAKNNVAGSVKGMCENKITGIQQVNIIKVEMVFLIIPRRRYLLFYGILHSLFTPQISRRARL